MTSPTLRVETAAASNGAAAQRGLWSALDTLECGRPDVLRAFFESIDAERRIVDVGCWNGSVCELAAATIGGSTGNGDGRRAPWSSYTGVDVVAGAVAEFRRRHAARPRTSAVEADVRALPLADGSADVLLCLFVLQDLGTRDDGLRALGELARVAAAGADGLVGLTVHASREEETYYVVRKLRAQGIPEKPTHHWRRADFLDALAEAGFQVGGVEAFGPNERGFVELYVRVAKGAASDQSAAAPSADAPPLFLDYVSSFERVADLFEHDYRDAGALVRASDIASSRELPRDDVADALLEQSRVFERSEAAERNIARLREPGSAAIVTGQQPALFGGPLYNLYKAATAVALAERLERLSGRPHVPLFWIANDDHQLSRLDHVHVVADDGTLVRIAWEHGRSRAVIPVAAVTLDGSITAAIDQLGATAARSPHRDDVLDLLRASYKEPGTFSDGFGRLLTRLFEREGLVVLDPSDPHLRRLGMPRLTAELDYPSPTSEASRRAAEAVAALGYPVQVALRDDRLNLFAGRSERFRVRCGPDGLQLHQGAGLSTPEEARSALAARAEDFSPNVLLRPLYQDALLPTAAYVAGPSEIAYFAQLRTVYARFGLPMPVVYPRASLTLLEPGRPQPAGAEPQERLLGIVHGLLRHGPELLPRVLSLAGVPVFEHQVVEGA